MPRTTRSQAKRNAETSSASVSRHSPTPSSDANSLPLPAPLTSRNLRPRVHVGRSGVSSRRGSQSATTSHAVSTANSRSSSVLSNATRDADSIVARERKRRRTEVDVVETAGNASGSSHLDGAPRPAWRDSEEFDDEEGVDQLDDSDSEETRTLRDPTTLAGPSTHPTFAQSDSVPSTRRPSATPPPPTAIPPDDDDVVEVVSTTGFGRPPSTSMPVAGQSNGGARGDPSTSLRSLRSRRETLASPVSSPSLMKIINETNIEPGTIPSKRKRTSKSPEPEIIEVSPIPSKDKGKGKAKALPSPTPPPVQAEPPPKGPPEPEAEPLSEYTCPICFFPPSNATLTPCGHVCCGSCLFTAVKTTLQRGANMGLAIGVGENVARCPVCRAIIPGWDGKGGGVVGIKVRQVISL